MTDEPPVEPPDDALAVVVRLRAEMLDAMNAVLPGLGPVEAFTLGGLHMTVMKLAGGLEAAIRCHRQEFLYGNAATDDEPDAFSRPVSTGTRDCEISRTAAAAAVAPATSLGTSSASRRLKSPALNVDCARKFIVPCPSQSARSP